MKRGDLVQTPDGYEGEVDAVQSDGPCVRVRLRKRPDGERVRSPLWWAGEVWRLVDLSRIERHDVPNNYEEPKMSDFKVGDVVRLKDGQRDAAMEPWMEYGRNFRVEPYPDADYLSVSPMDVATPRASGGWDPIRFSLVSRPSEAQSAPALKVGDRVRVKGTQHVGDVVRHATPGWWGVAFNGANGDTRVIGYEAYRLELLPPEPASKGLTNAAIADAERAIRGADLAGRYRREILGTWPDPKPPRPMTATEASIRARNQTDPMRDPEYTHEMDAMRYLWADAAQGARPMISGAKPLPDQDGWMPAGTYMPNKVTDVTRMRIPKTTIPYQADRFRDIPIPARARDMAYDGNHSLLVSTIPVPERRLSSRTNTYFNMGDEYDLLPDAE